MNIIVVGSMALQHHIPTVKVGKDVDYIMTYDDYKKFLDVCSVNVINCYPINKGKKMIIKTTMNIYEIEIAWEGSTAEEFMNLVLNDPMTKDSGYFKIPSMQALYTMKMSHRYLRNSPHFLKTMTHIKLMRDNLDDGDITPYWREWYKRRMDETYWYNHPNLDTTKDDFFKDESFYKYDHDDVHTSVKLGDKPAYVRILADGSPVKCDKDKFDALPYQYKLHCALEECYTLALERSQIPNEYKPNPKKSFDVALMKVCTSITSGWFREWCWENYHTIESAYNEDYLSKFKDFLEHDLIRPFKHDTMQIQ